MSATTVESNGDTIFTNDLYTINSSPDYIILGYGWTDILDNAFKDTGLTQITIPSSITSIGANSFQYTIYLKNITVDSNNNNYSDISGVLFNKNKTNLIQYPLANTITSYAIPSSVTSIEANAFNGAIHLIQIKVPSSVTMIGDSAFERIINLESVIFSPDSILNSIEKEAFFDTSKLTSIIIPSNVTSIGENVFQNSGLTTVYMLQSTITNLNNPNELNVSNPEYTDISFGSGKTFYGKDNVTILDYGKLTLFVHTDNSFKEIDISGQLTSSLYVSDISTNNIKSVIIGTKVTSISGETFQSATNLTQITIPSTVTEIGSNAFRDASNLFQIDIQDSVTSIGANAFNGASRLTSINIPYEVNILNEGMFQGATLLSSINFKLNNDGSSKISDISTNAFKGASSLSQITIPASITRIGENAFQDASGLNIVYMWPLTRATLNNTNPSPNLSDGSGQTFYGKENVTITTPSSSLFVDMGNNKYIVNNIIGGLNNESYFQIGRSFLNYVDIGTNVTSISANAFLSATAMTNITIPSSVTSIGENAFQGATYLRQITIPSSVTSIGANVFQFDTSLNYITVDSSNTNYSNDISGVLFNKNKTNLIQYPIASTITSYAIPSGVTNIENYAFQGAVNLVNITVPPSVTSIGQNAFQDASGLTSVIFQESTNLSKLNLNVGSGKTFFDASNQTIVTISIITQVFNGTGELTKTMTDLSGTNIARIEGYTSIGEDAFKDKTTLIAITIPTTVKRIGSRAFYGTTNLTNFSLPSSIISISGEAFYDMTNLTEITLPSSINSIGTDAFKNTGLTKVYVRPSTLGLLNEAIPSPNLIKGPSQTFYGKSNVTIDIIERGDTVGAAIGNIRTFISNDIYPNPPNPKINFDDISSNIIDYTNDLYIDYRVVITISNEILNNVSEYNKKRLLNKIKTVCAADFSIYQNTIRVAFSQSSNNIINVDVLNAGITESMVPICFPRGTLVTTDQGNVAIELLKPDIHTIRGKSIVAITQTRPIFEYIISIDKDALGKNIPSVKTEISKEHKVFYKGEMVKAKDLVELCSGVKKIPYDGETLYNVLMEKHEKMMVHNLICETLDPDNIMAKICRGKCSQKVKNKIYEELNAIIKTNNVPAYKKACDYLSANL